MSREPHDFDHDLAESHQISQLDFWEQVYRQAFPDLKHTVSDPQDGQHQRAGVDRRIILPGCRQVLIDEKYRKIDYGDIALEYIGNDRTNAPGWVCKDILADYIAYAVLPKGVCYLLPVVPLQWAWQQNSDRWLAMAKNKIVSFNRKGNYNTISCPVATNDLYSAIQKWHRQEFPAIKFDENGNIVLPE